MTQIMIHSRTSSFRRGDRINETAGLTSYFSIETASFVHRKPADKFDNRINKVCSHTLKTQWLWLMLVKSPVNLLASSTNLRLGTGRRYAGSVTPVGLAIHFVQDILHLNCPPHAVSETFSTFDHSASLPSSSAIRLQAFVAPIQCCSFKPQRC